MKTLTITVPSYNVSKYLPEILPTFLQPEIIDDIEILIVNDGSKDDTAEVAQRYCSMYPDSLFLVNKENGGHGSTINKGIELATGRYFRVVDGDDWVDPEAFKAYVNALKAMDSDLVLTPFNRVYENDGTSEVKGFKGLKAGQEYFFDDIITNLCGNYAIHSTTFKMEILKKIPPISENCFYVDQEYICYAIPFIETVAFVDETVYQYRLGSAGQSMNKKNMIKNRNMHRHVTMNIINLYESADVSEAKKNLLRDRALGLIDTQMNIFFSMDTSREVKEEIRSFIRDVETAGPDISGLITRKSSKLAWKSRGRLYLPAALLWKVKNNG